ncbi:hypothetical protein AGABI1DRAFT_13305, partial [Agaricus bisporus var. burnettii JB137-S8]
PPELHSYICCLACTDDGFTAQSLSLTSKYFAHVTLPYLYQSICLTTPSKIQSLYHKLVTTPAHRRRIRHLFISNTSSDREIANSINSILSFAAPTLETLALVSPSPSTSTSLIARLFRTAFPHLYELTVSGYYPYPSSPLCFPSLERLHLLGNRNPHGLLSLGCLESSMPELTHLRVSGLSLAVSFSKELEEAYTNNNTDECTFSSKLPLHLRHIIIERASESSSSNHKTARLKDQLMVKNLEAL